MNQSGNSKLLSDRLDKHTVCDLEEFLCLFNYIFPKRKDLLISKAQREATGGMKHGKESVVWCT